MGLGDTLQGLIVVLVAVHMSLGTFWMRAAFMSFPRELLDAARIDGAGSWATL